MNEPSISSIHRARGTRGLRGPARWALGLWIAAAACDEDASGGDDSTSDPDPTTTSTSTDDVPEPSGPELSVLIDYDIAAAEQPVDVFVIDPTHLAVTLPFIDELRIVSPQDGATLQQIPMPSPIGVTFDGDGGLIVTTAPGVFDPSFDPELDAPDHGVSRVSLVDGSVERIAQFPFAVLNPDGSPNPDGVLPRDAVVAEDGRVFVSDLAGGRIFVIEDGQSALWSDDPGLRGAPERPGPEGRPPFLTGVNGMRLQDGFLYACNTDFGRLLRFPIEADGSAGDPEVVIERPELLGFDEFELEADGSIVAILAFRYELIRIRDGEVTVLFGPEDGIDNPAGLSRGVGSNADRAFVTNLGFITNNAGGDAMPGLLEVSNLFSPGA